jgi:hypothetical protein
MSGVLEWFEERGEIPLLTPSSVREYGPLTDDSDEPVGADFVETIRGAAFAIEYCDAHGWMSTRTIRCLAIDPHRPASINAYCHVRDSVRTFRLDRIISIIDLHSGEVVSGDAYLALLTPYLSDARPDRKVRALMESQAAARDGVFALLQIAMADGVLNDAARAIAVEYAKEEAWAAGCASPPVDLLALWVGNLAPPLDSVMQAVRCLLADREKLARLLPWLLKLVHCPEVPHLSEDSLRELVAALRRHFREQTHDLPHGLRA